MKNYYADYSYTLYLRKDIDLTPEFIEGLGDHLYDQLDKITNVRLRSLIIEETSTRGQAVLHILLKTDIPRSILIEVLDRIKKLTPILLTTKRVIPKAIPIFTKYKGEMPCKDYRNKEKCPGKSNCNRHNEHGTLLCESNTNLEELKTKEQLVNQVEHMALKKNLPKNLYHYYNGVD